MLNTFKQVVDLTLLILILGIIIFVLSFLIQLTIAIIMKVKDNRTQKYHRNYKQTKGVKHEKD